jgi:DNA-binding CsgD family transcriptional regulator
VLDLDGFSKTVALIYDAAMDVDRWSEALACICSLFESQKGQISFGTSVSDSQSFFRFCGFANDELAILPRYRELIPRDPRMSPIRFKAIHCRQMVSEEVLHASEMYKEVLVLAGIEYSMWFLVDVDEHSGCALSVMRGPRDQPFNAQDCADLSRFVPHVQRATTMHETFGRLRREAEAARAVIDGVPLGVLVVDTDKLALANRTAREMLADGSAVKFHNGRLHATSADASARLSDAIREASSGALAPIGVTIPVGETDEVKVLIRALNASSAGMLGVDAHAVALYLSDPRKPVETPEETLQQLFGLTGREAAVLRALVQGDNLQAIGKRLGVGLTTVKTHMQNIMRATGVSRQAELVQVVLSSPAWMAAQASGRSTRARPAEL